MTKLKTKESTLRALERGTHHRPSAEELHKQRVSFIMGSLNADSSVTRERVEKILAEQQRPTAPKP